ncbi:hypothetical protein ACFPFV_02945 [Salinicoccus siamensis]|uniref:Uncharacterized protein n=1 Tax=Salinicoccus siamensis TaxID=381830 RepID=A0ABV5Z2M9_9STAP
MFGGSGIILIKKRRESCLQNILSMSQSSRHSSQSVPKSASHWGRCP